MVPPVEVSPLIKVTELLAVPFGTCGLVLGCVFFRLDWCNRSPPKRARGWGEWDALRLPEGDRGGGQGESLGWQRVHLFLLAQGCASCLPVRLRVQTGPCKKVQNYLPPTPI